MIKKVAKTVKVMLLSPLVLVGLLLVWIITVIGLLLGTVIPLTGIYVYSAIYRIWNT